MFRLMKSLGIICVSATFIIACKVNKNSSSANSNSQNVALREVMVRPQSNAPYRYSETREVDEEYMNLAISFDYASQYVYGKAVLKMRPYFYELKVAEIDAQGFDIKRVALLSGSDTLNLKYEYNGKKLLVFLDRAYNRKEIFELFIDYIAKPNELKTTKGMAIRDDKGLYFINPTGAEKNKPRQIWSQGETQSNSCWFPTIDAPNEKFIHDIAITVEDNDLTLSNGELMMSKNNEPGMRTDYWKQTLPHAPYLVMIAVGGFAKIKDYWRDSIAVNYYVEPAYKQYAKMVFGNTPEMMEVFSKKLGVDYPWNKFAQIVVRDFVSGAMENTSAVIHYDALQHDAREHLDNPHEDIIAHELFHHWFGDLVTCESWSNIPLNESFATYGEYIWQEHKYGQMEADKEFYNNLHAYLAQKSKHKTIPIRYHYGSRDEMFDVVSYQKGGYILHMLRKQVGDEAFFAALNLYLKTNAYKTVELHNLRLAFEEVTGRDLNWFFNQWFFRAGHPQLQYTYAYSNDRKQVTVNITQLQDTSEGPYRLPIDIDVYTNGKVEKHEVIVLNGNQQFTFNTTTPVDFVNIDANQCVPASITDNKTAAEYKAAIKKAPLYMDKHYAVKGWTPLIGDTLRGDDIETINYLLNHNFWGVRDLGLSVFEKLDSTQQFTFTSRLLDIASDDSKSSNRAEAIMILANNNALMHKKVFERATNDSSYMVVASALQALAMIDFKASEPFINEAKKLDSRTVQLTLAAIFSENGTTDEVAFFEKTFDKYGRYNFGFLNAYANYLEITDKQTQLKAIPGLKSYHSNTKDELVKSLMPGFVRNMQGPWKDKIIDLEAEKVKAKKNAERLAEIDKQIAEAQAMIEAYEDILK